MERNLTLDLAKLSDDERREGSIFLGGTAAKYVVPGNQFEYAQVETVVFDWGDAEVPRAIDAMLASDTRSRRERIYRFPFCAATVLDDELWHLAVQEEHFNPARAFRPDRYLDLPYEDPAEARAMIERGMAARGPRPLLLGAVGAQYFLFEMGMKIKAAGKSK